MDQLFFLLEYNLSPLQKILRKMGQSAFLTYDKDIGIPANANDAFIVAKVSEQKQELGIDRILVTRDEGFITYLGSASIKIIVLTDKKDDLDLYQMRLNKLCETIVMNALEMVRKTRGQSVAYVECSQFY